jgi:hypothetical protein
MASYVDQVPKRTEIQLPSLLHGQSNGLLDPSVRQRIPSERPHDPAGFELTVPAARAYTAMHAAARADNVIVKPTSSADTYRTLANQQRLFEARYEVDAPGGGCKRCADGVLRCRKCGANGKPVATAACPGTSNHGWGLAVDIDLRGPTDILGWLEQHARSFGFGWETVPEEKWHIRYFVGDAIPAAVLAFEAGSSAPVPAAAAVPVPVLAEREVPAIAQGDDDMPTHRWAPKGFRNEFEIPGGLPVTPAELLNPDQSGAFLNEINPFGELKLIIEFHTHRLTAIIHRNGITAQQIADGYFIRDPAVELTAGEAQEYARLGIPV